VWNHGMTSARRTGQPYAREPGGVLRDAAELDARRRLCRSHFPSVAERAGAQKPQARPLLLRPWTSVLGAFPFRRRAEEGLGHIAGAAGAAKPLWRCGGCHQPIRRSTAIDDGIHTLSATTASAEGRYRLLRASVFRDRATKRGLRFWNATAV